MLIRDISPSFSLVLARLGDASRSIVGIEHLLIVFVVTATPNGVTQPQGLKLS